MLSEEPATEPRRKWHLLRWTFVVFAVGFGWGGWRHYDFRQAVKEAKERGWNFTYSDPVAIIRQNWKAAFREETWNGPERWLGIETDALSERDFNLVRRLKPKQLQIMGTFPWRDLSRLKGLSNLTELTLSGCPNLANIDALTDLKKLTGLTFERSPVLVNINAIMELKNLTGLGLDGCTALTNVDALRALKALKELSLYECAGLKNVDGLLGLKGLEFLNLEGCTGLTKEAVDAVKAALPKTNVVSDYDK